MIRRILRQRVLRRLREFPAVALLGPRQVGKTTLALSLEPDVKSPLYLDLENPADLAKLSDPGAYLRAQSDRLVILDEVQRAPGIFQVLRGVIDERVRDGQAAAQYLLLGSASLDLLRQSSESLAGRIAFLELGPLDIREVEPELQSSLWVRGGYPRSLLAASDDASAAWRANFVATYLERDIPTLGPRIPAETLRRFWTMLAHRQGSLLNAAELARSLGVDGKTVASYLDLMVDLLMVRRLEPLHANVGKRLTKSPKTYVRDSGLVHSLLGLDTMDDILSHPIAGGSWEGLAVETLIAAAPPRTRPTFYRTAAGAEMDLVLDMPGTRRWAIEVKRSTAPALTRGFHSAQQDLVPERTFVVYPGTERYPMKAGAEAIGLRQLAELLEDPAAVASE